MKVHKEQLKVYAVTDRKWAKERTLEEQIGEALKAGVTFLQLREKNMQTQELIEEAVRVRKLANRCQVPLVLNDQVEAVLACGANGVHIGQKDMEVSKAREMLGPDKILGVTARTVEQALCAQEQGADYLGVGAAFPTCTKADTVVITKETILSICEAVTIPVVVIGGVSVENIKELRGTKASGVAAVSAIFGSGDIYGAVKAIRKEVEEALWQEQRAKKY